MSTIISRATVKTLESMRNDENYGLFWAKVTKFAEDHEIDGPILPRRRNAPIRYNFGQAPAEHPETPENDYRLQYFEGREFRKIKRNMFCLSLIVLRGLLTGQACEAAGNADSSVISTNRFRWVGFLGYNMRRVILGIWRPCTVALAITFHPEFPISNFEFIISSNLRYVKKKVLAEDCKSCRRF